MEKKTDLSEEFGPLSNPPSREPDESRVGLDSKTDPNSEYHRPPDPFEATGVDKLKKTTKAKRRDRKERHRLSLLLQVAAAGLGVVLVGNSFGRDILNEGVFENPTDAFRCLSYSQYVDGEFQTVTLYKDNAFTPEGIENSCDAIRYDPGSNTLYLNYCAVDALECYQMGSDFTIYVENDSSVGQIRSLGEKGCDIHIDGAPDTTLTVNRGGSMGWAHGLFLASSDRSALSIGPDITVDIYGYDGAVAVVSDADPAIVYDPALTSVTGILTSGQGLFQADFEADTDALCWTFTDSSGNIANDVVFSPGSGLAEGVLTQHSELYVTQTNDATPIYLVQYGQVTDIADQIRGLSYDLETNTLSLDDYRGGHISASMMGDNFTIQYTGDNTVDSIYSKGSSIASGSLTIKGGFGDTLSVNKDQEEAVGIMLAANQTDSTLTVDWGTELEVYGTDSAILVSTTAAPRGIIDLPVELVTGDTIVVDSPGYEGYTDWYISDSVGSSTVGTAVQFDQAFDIIFKDGAKVVSAPLTLYLGAPYENPYVSTTEIQSNTLIPSGGRCTVTNRGSLPVYIYLYQYIKHDSPTIIEIAVDSEWTAFEEMDMQGKYYCNGSTMYLATDGASYYWDYSPVINSEVMPDDIVIVAGGESVTFTLPEDGTDSIYDLRVETYSPEFNYYWWIYDRLKFNNT